MRRTGLMLTVLLVALLAAPAGAPAFVGGAGHNKPTKKLEKAFKWALYLRSISEDGCYPPPKKLAKEIRRLTHRRIKVRVAKGPRSVHRLGVVYILRRGSNCNRVRMALRTSRGLYILDSTTGNVRVFGRHGPRTSPGQSGPPRRVRLVTRSFRLQGHDDTRRLDTLCPRRSFPIGGGMIASPGPGAGGEGIYAHSYERLGAQRGWHINAILFDPDGGGTSSRAVTVQTVCGRGLRPANPSPHATIFIRSGQVKSTTASCPKGQFLIAGGFQRTNFDSTGGNYVTESRAAGPRGWRVTGSAFGGSGGGELTAIAYCVKHRGPILTAVSGSASVPFGGAAAATTPPCPAGLTLTSTGFTASPNALFAGSSLNSNGTSTATAFGYFGSDPDLTAFGYCLRAR